MAATTTGERVKKDGNDRKYVKITLTPEQFEQLSALCSERNNIDKASLFKALLEQELSTPRTQVAVQFTDEEYENLEKVCRQKGLDPSPYLRSLFVQSFSHVNRRRQTDLRDEPDPSSLSNPRPDAHDLTTTQAGTANPPATPSMVPAELVGLLVKIVDGQAEIRGKLDQTTERLEALEVESETGTLVE